MQVVVGTMPDACQGGRIMFAHASGLGCRVESDNVLMLLDGYWFVGELLWVSKLFNLNKKAVDVHVQYNTHPMPIREPHYQSRIPHKPHKGVTSFAMRTRSLHLLMNINNNYKDDARRREFYLTLRISKYTFWSMSKSASFFASPCSCMSNPPKLMYTAILWNPPAPLGASSEYLYTCGECV